MMKVVGVDEKGNVMIEKTCSIGKTEEMFQMKESLLPDLTELAEILEVAFQRIAEILEMLKQAIEVSEKREIRRVQVHKKRIYCSRVREKTQHRAKSAWKYKRYELRIYGRAERK